jgi:hypothetical protein
MTVVSRLMPVLLLAISAVLFLWGVAGLVEYVLPPIGFGLQNEAFPPGLQFLHFLSILVTGAVFIVGYLARWRHTPFAIVVMYAVLARCVSWKRWISRHLGAARRASYR